MNYCYAENSDQSLVVKKKVDIMWRFEPAVIRMEPEVEPKVN